MEKRKLSSLCLLEKGKQIDTDTLDDNKSFPYVNGGIKESGFYESYNTSGDTITISEGGASCGFVNYRNDKFWCGCHCYRLTEFNVNFKYLYFALKANQKNIMDLRSGVAMPNIKKSRLEDLIIKIDENATKQDKIVEELSELTECIDKEQMAIIEFNELIKSRFIEMFGEPTLISDGHKFRECAKALVRGPFGSSLKKEYFVPEGIDTYKVYEQKHAIEDNENIGTYYIDKERYNRLKRFSIQENDIIMSCSGTIGKTHIFTKNAKKGIINQALLLIRLDPTVCNTIFFINQMELITSLLSTKGTAQVNIASIKILGDMDFLLPPIKRQNEFASFVTQVDKLKFNAQKRIDLYQELLNKKMDEYFN